MRSLLKQLRQYIFVEVKYNSYLNNAIRLMQ